MHLEIQLAVKLVESRVHQEMAKLLLKNSYKQTQLVNGILLMSSHASIIHLAFEKRKEEDDFTLGD